VGRPPESSKDSAGDKEPAAGGPRTEATKNGGAHAVIAPPSSGQPRAEPTAGKTPGPAPGGGQTTTGTHPPREAAPDGASADGASPGGASPGGASAGGVLLAFVGIAGIVALLCYLAWQLFFAGAA
jgi:hypothetical protein